MVVIVVGLVCNLSQAAEVTATGYGGSYEESLQNAKVLATEQAASTFITSKQELIDGKFKEILKQYSGGLVRKYKVTNTLINKGVYEITITADVNADKINKIIENGESSPMAVAAQIEKAIDEHDKTASALTAISAISNPFAVVVDGAEYVLTDDGETIRATYHMHLVWNPKYVDDLKQLVTAVDRNSGSSAKEICFGSKSANNFRCGGITILPNNNLWRQRSIPATIQYADGRTSRPVFASMFTDHHSTSVAMDLYSYSPNYRHHVEIAPSNTPVRFATNNWPGYGNYVNSLHSSMPVQATTDVLFIYPDAQSAPFVACYSIMARDFKNISNVTFSFPNAISLSTPTRIRDPVQGCRLNY